MKYGQIAGSTRFNSMIYYCFDHICEDDERKFVKKFREHPPDSDQIMHTFRELVLGSYLSSRGFKVRHEFAIDDQTPDWSILDAQEETITGLVELTSFHVDKATQDEIAEQIRARGLALCWRDQNKDNVERLYQSIWRKAPAYKTLIEQMQVPYVVAVFGEFEAAMDFEEVCLCLFDEETGLFAMYPELSGVLYFEESFGRYSFKYVSNPNASQTIELPSGIFTSEAA